MVYSSIVSDLRVTAIILANSYISFRLLLI